MRINTLLREPFNGNSWRTTDDGKRHKSVRNNFNLGIIMVLILLYIENNHMKIMITYLIKCVPIF